MRFEPDDEKAFFARRDELGEQFAGWLTTHGVPGDPNDAGLLMDWKWGYADGELDRWRVADVHEFLFDWCPRKLSSTPEDSAGIPASAAAFVEFLAHSGMLAGGDSPAQIRKHCERNRDRFVTEMGNPANFGMAKSMFASAGGLEPGAVESAEDLETIMARLTGPPQGAAGELPASAGDEPRRIGPVRVPEAADVRASATAAPLLVAMRELARYCATPGRTLTAKGNLRIADARHLVDQLGTGDNIAGRAVRSAEDLPGLSWYLHLGIESGAVRRYQGKLVAVTRFAELDDVAAHEKLTRAVLGSARSTPAIGIFAFLGRATEVLDDSLATHLFELLHGDADVDELVEMVHGIAAPRLGGLISLVPNLVPEAVENHLQFLGALGTVEVHDRERTACAECDGEHLRGGRVTLTPIGVHTAVWLARAGGIEVLERPDPARADAAAIVDLTGVIDEQEWMRDVCDWFAIQPDPAAAATALASAAFDERRGTLVAMAGLQALDEVAPDHAVPAARPHLEGAHDGILVTWMLEHSALDPGTVDPTRLVRGLIDAMAAVLDAGGPDEMIPMLDGGPQEERLELLDAVWRMDHPRLADVLEAIGAHHPTKAVAKAARKALVQHRSRLASSTGSDAAAVPGRRRRRRR